MQEQPPGGLPRYRLLSGPDDESFCRRVSAALDLGYHLHGGPAVTTRGGEVVVAQAVVWVPQAGPPAAAEPEPGAGREST